MPDKRTPPVRSSAPAAGGDANDVGTTKPSKSARRRFALKQKFTRQGANRASSSSAGSSCSATSTEAPEATAPIGGSFAAGKAKLRQPHQTCLYVNVPTASADFADETDESHDGIGGNFQRYVHQPQPNAQFRLQCQQIRQQNLAQPASSSSAALPTLDEQPTTIVHPDNRITIHVKYDDERPAQVSTIVSSSNQSTIRLSQESIEPRSSARSSDASYPARRNSAHAQTQSLPFGSVDGERSFDRSFQERPIDVPEDFEREAYAAEPHIHRALDKVIHPKPQLTLSLQDFLETPTARVEPSDALPGVVKSDDEWSFIDSCFSDSDEDWIELDQDIVSLPTSRITSADPSPVSITKPVVKMKTIKNKLQKHARLFKITRKPKDKHFPPDLNPSTSVVSGSSAFELLDIEDDDDDTNSDSPDKQLLAAKRQLLERFAPYCHSTDPLASYRQHLPANISIDTVSILTRSTDINSSLRRRIVGRHMQGETQPRAILSRRFWSQSNLFVRPEPAGGARRSLGASTQSALRRFSTSLANLSKTRESMRKSQSNVNLCEEGRINKRSSAPAAATAGATQDYCPGGVYKRSLQAPPKKPKLLNRLTNWRHMRRNRYRRFKRKGRSEIQHSWQKLELGEYFVNKHTNIYRLSHWFKRRDAGESPTECE